ncbi:response regulator [Pseudomonas sp. v388]|uniref:response regulator n=1 Tax=Pseudomonas sp. v388 TaxID=2479849 RepID=UPI000F795EC2|nr:response regulator [Pseudomonas sp. v388]RRV06312.1 response regulator [Pseudomonas sp. v388]
MIRVGLASVSLERREAFRDGQMLRMGGRAFDILATLIRAEGRIVSKDTLISQVWQNTIVENNNLEVHISHLRKLLGGKDFIQTVPRRGYRLLAESAPPSSGFLSTVPALPPVSEAPLSPLPPRFDAPTTVYIIDDDAAVRTALSRLLRAEGIPHVLFGSAEDFLQTTLPCAPACLLLDVSLPAATGLELQAELVRRGRPWPIVFMTGFGTIPMSVQAIKAGAVEFLTKPFNDEQLLSTLRQVMHQAHVQRDAWSELKAVQRRLESLTPREHEVLGLLVTGISNKQLANELGISEVTAKVHKKHVMAKMQARTLIDLVNQCQRADALPAHALTS